MVRNVNDTNTQIKPSRFHPSIRLYIISDVDL